MKSNAWMAAIVWLLSVAFLSAPALAAESSTAPAAVTAAAPAAPLEEEPDYAFGTAKSVNGDELTINEFDYDTGEEKEAVYYVDAQTEYDNVGSAKEIAAGDEVDIDYLVKDGKKVAVAISVAKPVEGEEGA